MESLEKVFWPETDEYKIAFSLIEQLAQMAQYVQKTYECEEQLLVARQYDKLVSQFSHMVDSLRFLTYS